MKYADIEWKRTLLALLLAILCLIARGNACAGGPRWVAGPTYFAPSAKGKPIVWANGTIHYYFDRGNLSPTVTNTQAQSLVAGAVGTWNSISTAAVALVYFGSLAEDVNGTNVIAGPNGVIMPADIQPTATSRPLGIILDEDGSVIDAFFGPGASSPANCQENGVLATVDNIATSGYVAHSLMLIQRALREQWRTERRPAVPDPSRPRPHSRS